MKKCAASLFLALVLCFAVVAVPFFGSSLSYVEESYLYEDAVIKDPDWGKHATSTDGALTEEPFFGDGLWSYEYFDTATKTFHPMGAYFGEKQECWAHGGWSGFYTASAQSAFEDGPLTYCTVGVNGRRLHPGDGAGAVVTFHVPESGNVTYLASVYSYGSNDSSDPNGGSSLKLYLNDTCIYPATEEESYFYVDTSSEANPMEIRKESFDVEEGDRLRLVLTVKPGTTKASKGVNFVQFPEVQYHSSENSPTFGPAAITFEASDWKVETTADTAVVTRFLEERFSAIVEGMNLYLNGEKVNDVVITEKQYVIRGLSPDTVYEIAAEPVLQGNRNPSSIGAPIFIRTEKASAPRFREKRFLLCGLGSR